ncbi:MAG: hypothetical protein PHS02_00800 [Candidatus ainarchaeum sp.]|nr:hypothetical protein [Candidatus ainarchaeum sp.]
MRKMRKEPQRNIAKNLALAVLFITLFSLLTFSVQYIYSNNLDIQVHKTYGLYQNSVFQDTGDMELPSSFAVRKTTVLITNTADTTRQVILSMAYSGSLDSTEPSASILGSTLSWVLEIGPRQTATVSVFGKGLDTETPSLSFVDFGSQQSISNKQLFIPASAAPVTSSSNSFSYVRQDVPDSLLGSFVADQKKLDLFSKSAIVILAGLVLLTMVGGLGSVLSPDPKPKSVQRPRILIAPRQEDYFSEKF